MAGKKESTYMYNAKMSMRNLTADLNSSYFNNTKTLVTDVKSGYREAVDSSKSSGFSGIKNRLKQTALFKFASDLTKNAFEGLRTGKFYKSDDDLFGFDESAFDFDFDSSNTGGDFFFDDSGDSTPQQATSEPVKDYKGDSATFGAVGKLAKSMTGASKASSNAVINATVEGLFKTAHSINQTIVSANADLKAEIIENKGHLKNIAEIAKEQLTQQQKLVAIQTEMLTEHKAMKEMFSDYMLPKINKKEDDSKRGIPEWYDSIRKGEMLKAGKSMAGEAFRAIDMEKTQGAFGLAKAMLPMLMMTMGANPFKFFKDMVIEGKLNKWFGLDKFSQKIERMVGSTQDFANRQFQTMSLSSNATAKAVGRALMVKPESLDKVATDKYDKSGKVFFDGATREAIVNVIPTYLSSMVSLLSGKERTVYDYNKGVFKTISQAKQEFQDNRPKLDYEYERLAEILKKNMKEDDRKNLDEERFLKLTKYMMTNMARMGYDIATLKNHNYNDAKLHMDFKDTDLSESDFYKLRDLMYKAETNKDTADSFWSINKSTKNYVWDSNDYNVNYAKDSRMNGGIATFNQSHLLDEGATVFGGNGKKKMGFNYHSPTFGENIVDMSRKDGKVGNIIGTTMSDEELALTRNFIKDNMSSLTSLFKANIANSLKDVSTVKFFEDTLKLKDSKVFQNLKATSPYDLESIIGHQRKIERIVSGKLATEVFNQELDDFNVTEKDKEKMADVLTDPALSEDERTKRAKDILYHSSEFKKKLEELKGKFKKKTGIDIDEKVEAVQDKINDAKLAVADVAVGSGVTSVGDTVNKAKATIKDYGSKAGDMVKDVTSSGVSKTKEFYEKNKETIWNVSKAAMIGAAGIGIFKTLKKSMVGPIIGMTGLASPIALGAIALGAGIYAYKNNIFDKLFGDNKKAKELRERTGRILKSTLAIGGGIAGISGILSLATPLGFIGPVNAALAGLAISIAGESKGFKRFLFGTEEGSFLSNLKVWMIGDKDSGKKGILTKMTEKVTTFFSKGFKSMGRWFKLDVWEPLKSTFKPIKDFMSNTATKIFGGLTGIGDKLTGSFTTDFVKPFFVKMKEKVIDPVAGFFKKIFGGIFGFLGKIIAAPFKGLRTLITGQTDSSVFASNYGSSNAQVAEKAEYKANMSAKEKLWNDNKYKMTSLEDIDNIEGLSDKDKKTLRKMYVKEKTREHEEAQAVQKAKEADEKDKEGKSGQGIWDTATKYYFNQNKITSKIAGAFMGNSTLCGLAALAQAISAVLDTKIDPAMLAQKSFGWVGSRNGVSPEFMLEVCRKFGIGARYMKNPKADTITKILKKDTIMIVEVDDFETDSLHYLVVRRVEGGVAYYSDPARRKNMAVSIDVLEAKARRAIYLYKKAETSSQVATSAPAVVTTKETEVASTQTGDTLGAISDSSVHKETIFEKAKKFMSNIKDKVTGATSAIADKMSNLTGARGRKKAAEYYTGKKSDLYKLLKDWKKKYQEDAIRLKETIELQTSSLAYNAEYIKRILVKVHGDIPGFGEKDIKNKHFSRIGNWFKRQWRKVKAIPAMVGSLLYNKFLAPIVSFGFKMVKGFKKVLYDFPKWLGAKIWTGFIKPIGGLVVGTIKGIWGAFKNVVGTFKDMAVGFVKGVTTVFRAAVKGLFDGAMYVVKNLDKVFLGIGKLIHHAVKGIGHFIKWGVEAIGTSIKWTVETIGKGIGWLINKAFNFAGFIGKSILGLFGMKRKAALQEVFVVGGTLDSVRIVEVVKSVGAVDLEYAESIERKMGPAGGIIQKAVRAGGNTWQRLIGRRKSPSMKSGDEYAKIDKKQDAEAQQAVALVDGKDGKGKEEKKEASWWEKLLGLGVMGFGLWKSGLLGKILEGLGALKDKIFEMLGIKDNKEEDFKDKPSRDRPAFGYGTLGDVVEWKDQILEKVGVTGSLNRDRERHMAYSSWTHLGLKLGTKVGVTQLAAKGAKKGFKAIAAQIMKEVSEFGASNFAKKLFGKEAKSKLGKVFKMLTDKAVKGAERQVMEGTAEATVRTASYGVPIAGLLIDGLFALGNFIYGMWNAKDIMGVTKVSWKMRFGVGLASAIYDIFTSKIIFAWIPIVVPLEFLARNIYYYCIADEEEKAAYDEDHKAWEEIKKKEEEEARKAKEAQEKNVKQLQEYSKGFDDGFKTTDTGFFDIDTSAVKTTQVSQADIERMRNQMVKNGEESAQRAQNERARLDARYKKEMEEKARMNKRFGWTDDGGNQVGAGPLAGYGPIKTGIGQIDMALNTIVKPTTEKMAQGATMEEAVTSSLSSPQEMASSLGVSNIREYEAGARNSLTDKLNASIYGSSAEAMRNLNLSAFADNISKMFGIDLNGQNLSSSDGSADGSMGGNSVYTGTPDNRKLQERAKDPKFRKDMQDMWNYASAKWGPDVARNMMAISYSESRWRQDAYNKTGGAAGMFQVIPKYRPAWGFGINEDPRTFSPMEQIARVGPKLMAQLGKHAPSVHNLYAILHYPKSLGYKPDQIVYSKGSLEYSWNHGLDRNKDGHVKAGEVTEFAAEAYPQTKKAALEMGLNGYVVDKFNPYSVSQGNVMASLGATKSQQMGLQQGYGPIKHINQTSNKWNKLSMGGLSFKEAGCGPAVMAMLLDKLDIKYNMQELVSKAIAMKKGAMGGTPMTYFKTVLAEHGVASAILTTSVVKTFIKELRAGKSPILLTVSSTGAPHFIIGKEIKNGKLYINDPEKSNSEAITLNDIRLRKAKAILVYKVKGSVKNKVRNMVDTLKGGYGALKSFVMPKLEGFGNAREAIYNTVERMVKQGGYGPTIINNNSSNDISDTSKVVKAISKAQENNKNVTDLLSSIDSNIEKISRGRDNEQIGDNSVLSSILTEVKNTNAYLAKLVELMANAFGDNKNFTVNGRQVMQTIGGIPQPVTNGVSPDTVDFYRTVDRIVRGQAL